MKYAYLINVTIVFSLNYLESVARKVPKIFAWIFVFVMMVSILTDFVIFPAKKLD